MKTDIYNPYEEPMMKTTGLSFIEAVRAAKETGCKIRQNFGHISDKTTLAFNEHGDLTFLDGEPFTFTVNALTDNWEIVLDPPKTMGIYDALKASEQGKKVKRLAWNVHDVYPLGSLINKFARSYSIEDFEATDWVIVEPPALPEEGEET